ncbi:hypothetical protein OA183_01025 [Flavobacteriales bacterium]|nr:hypothetical protein [Flavobacteriales bacterium]
MLKIFFTPIWAIGGIKNILLIIFHFSLLSLSAQESENKHQIGLDPGDFIQLFSSNDEIRGLNYKYQFSNLYKLRLGGYYTKSNNTTQGSSYKLRIGLERIKKINEKIVLNFAVEGSKYYAYFNNRDNTTIKYTFSPIIGVQINTFKNMYVSFDYHFPIERTKNKDINSFSTVENEQTYSYSIFDETVFMLGIRF